MENSVLTASAPEMGRLLKKQKIRFWLGMFGTASLILIFILIDIYFGEIFKGIMNIYPSFRDYYSSISKNDRNTIVNMLYQVISMSVPAIIGMIIFRLNPKRVLCFKAVDGKTFSAIVFFGVGIQMLANYATTLTSKLAEAFHYSTEYTDQSMGDNVMEIVLRTILISCFPAFFEEFIFRGAILQSLRKYSCDSFAIFFSAFLFGLVHGNIVQTPFAFIGGVYFGRNHCKDKFNFAGNDSSFYNQPFVMLNKYDK